MPRVDHTAQVIAVKGFPDPIVPVALSADLTFFASDATNKEMVNFSEGLILIAWNSGATPRTVTISSVKYQGRTGDIGPYTIGVGLHSGFGPFPNAGFRQVDGKLYFEAAHLDVKWALLLVS